MSATARPKRSARWTQVHQISGELKTLLSAYRFYGAGHDILHTMCASLYQALRADLSVYEELSLDVSQLALSFEGRPLFEAPNQKESLTHPLFIDGVQLIGFDDGVQPRELMELVRVWARSLDSGEDSLSSFVTEFWEGEFDFVRIFAVDSFHEGDESDDARASLDHYDELLNRLRNESVMAVVEGPRTQVVHIMREDHSLLEQVGLRVSDDELKRRDRDNALACYELSAELAEQMVVGLSCADVEAVERFLHAVMLSIQSLSLRQVEALQELVERVLLALAERRHFDVLAACIAMTVPSRGALDPRAPVLENRAFVEPLLNGLQDPDALPYVLQTLLHVPAQALDLMLDALVKMPASDGRDALARVVHAKQPSVELLASRIGLGDAGLALLFLEMGDGYAEHDRRRLYKAALRHADAGVRYRVLQSITPERYGVLRGELYGLLNDAELRVRREALDMVMRMRDRGAVAALAARMGSDLVPRPEQRMVVAALGRLGGRSAGRALRAEFEASRDARMRAMVLLALTRAEGEDARAVLQKHAKKFLVSRQIKEAALEGLKRLDAAASSGARAGDSSLPPGFPSLAPPGYPSQAPSAATAVTAPPGTATSRDQSLYPSKGADASASSDSRSSWPAGDPRRAATTVPAAVSTTQPSLQDAARVAEERGRAQRRSESLDIDSWPAAGAGASTVPAPANSSHPPDFASTNRRHHTLPSALAQADSFPDLDELATLTRHELRVPPLPADLSIDVFAAEVDVRRSEHNLRRPGRHATPPARRNTALSQVARTPTPSPSPSPLHIAVESAPPSPSRTGPPLPSSSSSSMPLAAGAPADSLGFASLEGDMLDDDMLDSAPDDSGLPPADSRPDPLHVDPLKEEPGPSTSSSPRAQRGGSSGALPTQQLSRPHGGPSERPPRDRAGPVRRPSVVFAAESPSSLRSARIVELAIEQAQHAMDNDRVAESIAILKHCLRTNTSAVALYLLLADAQEVDGRTEEAIQSLYQAVLLEPGRVDVAERLWRLRNAQKSKDEP